MIIALNLLPIKTGGGLQVAFDVLSQISNSDSVHDWIVIARKQSPFVDYVKSKNIKYFVVDSNNKFSRLYFEYIGCKYIAKKYKIDVVFTLFGPQLPGINAINVVGCAYSNLMYPEIKFWAGVAWPIRFYKYLIDKFRLHRLLSADVRIFETRDLAKRAIELYNLKENSVAFVAPAVSSLVDMNQMHESTNEKCKLLPSGYRVVLISNYHTNKNIELLLETANELNLLGEFDVKFILTLDVSDNRVIKLLELSRRMGVDSTIYNFGPVPQEGCSELYRHCNAAVLPSTLESFSNMIAESWEMQLPLLISDLDWSRDVCGEGAMYFRHKDAVSLAKSIIRLKDNKDICSRLVRKGADQLLKHPTSKERFDSYFEVIEKVYKNKK